MPARHLMLGVTMFTFLISGCSYEVSIEDQTKLVEYEKCLEIQIAFKSNLERLFQDGVISDEEYALRLGPEYHQKMCEKYRPSSRKQVE